MLASRTVVVMDRRLTAREMERVAAARPRDSRFCRSLPVMRSVCWPVEPDTYVHLMDQYNPAGKVDGTAYPEINRRLTSAEFRGAQGIANGLGLRRLDIRRPHPPAATDDARLRMIAQENDHAGL